MRLMADRGVRAGEDGRRLVRVPEIVQVYDVRADVRWQRVMDEALVVVHLFHHFGGDEHLETCALDPADDEITIDCGAALVVRDLGRTWGAVDSVLACAYHPRRGAWRCLCEAGW